MIGRGGRERRTTDPDAAASPASSAGGTTTSDPTSPGATRVTLDGVAHSYVRDDGTEVRALDRVDLDIEAGSFVCIVGPSGCGKSTLLRSIAGFIHPSDGTIEVGGRAVDGPGPERGVVFQEANLFPWLTVAGNVEYGLKAQHVPKVERRETVERMLTLVGLPDVGALRPYELSGGMQQRCQLARVLATDPGVLLMDEPFGALDAMTRARLQDELISLWHGTHRTVFFITHSVDEAIYLGSRVLVMSPRPGRVVLDVSSPFSSAAVGSTARDQPEFIELRATVSAAIEAG